MAFGRNTTATAIPPAETAIETRDELIMLASEEHQIQLFDLLSRESIRDPDPSRAIEK